MLGTLLWNAAIVPDESAREAMLQDLLREVSNTEEEAREFREVAGYMLARHRKMFPELHR